MNLLALTLTAAVAAQLPKSPKEELKQLQGAWAIQSIEEDGRKIPDEDARKITLTITNQEYVYASGDQSARGKFSFDQRKDPKRIDVMPADGPNKGKTRPGIYLLDGDMLTVCLGPPDGKRPEDFSAESGSGRTLYALRRGNSSDDAPKEEPKNP
jgi:uncharacterized protein (TIGR03067 family)